MPIRQKQFPVRFTPRGLSDAFDSTDTFPGACTSLANVVFDQANPEIAVSRPGVTSITSFTGFSSPGVVSVQTTIGNLTYGMIASSRNVGKDEPFVWDNVNSVFISPSNVTNANTPTTQATSGAWTPPTITNVGTMVIVTHPGFPGGATKFGWFDITNPAAPVWNAGDTATNALPSVPTAVSNFNNRAYFACGNVLDFTDVLTNPPTRTNASQSLTVGDSSSITALTGLPVQTTSGGVVQALIAFKTFQTWQVTGDSTTSNLSLNFLSLTVGCSMPRSVAQSPLGTYFGSSFGPYVIDQFGVMKPLTHSNQQIEPDVHVPWENATTPTRVVGGYTGTIYRVCMNTTVLGNTATNDYWFDEHKRRWTGPHSFSYDSASQFGAYMILSSNASPGMLFKSEIQPSSSSVYTDNGTAFTSTLVSSTFPKTQDVEMNQVVESTVELASAGGAASYQITANDELGNTLNSCQVSIQPSGALWGNGVWGGFKWASSTNIPTTYTVPWTSPLVFNKMSITISSTATTALSFGTFFARYQKAGYRLALGGRQ